MDYMHSRLYPHLTSSDTECQCVLLHCVHGLAVDPHRELGHSSTVFKCHFDLGSLHLKEQHPSLALGCFREALKLAREKRNQQWEAEALKEMGQVSVCVFVRYIYKYTAQSHYLCTILEVLCVHVHISWCVMVSTITLMKVKYI